MPGISAGVPLVLGTNESLAPRNIATFSLEAHANGVGLPGGSFTDPKNTLLKQIRNYISASCGPRDPLKLELSVDVREDLLTICVSTTSAIPTFRLKPVLEGLNAVRAGLGWFVYDVIVAATQDRYPMYLPRDICGFAEHMWFDVSMSDEDFAQQLRDNEGWDETMSIEQLKAEHQGIWPSDLERAFDDHAWMLNASVWDSKKQRLVSKHKAPKRVPLAAAKKVARDPATPAELRSVVQAALDLSAELEREDSALNGDHWLTDEESAERYYYHHDADEMSRIGGACMIVWDDTSVFYEVLSHWEEFEMNGGNCSDIHYAFRGDPQDQAAMLALVKSFRDFVSRHAAISKVLQHFPQED